MESEDDGSAWNSKMCESMVSAWWDELRERNRLSLQSCGTDKTSPFSVLTPPIVEVIFTIAHVLHQPAAVRYMALEIFDRFVRLLFAQLCNYMKTSTSGDASHARQWSRILTRTRNQTVLRIVSCLQLASKLNLSTQALSPAVVQDFLRQIQQPFSRHSIMASERRVLKTINFQFGVPACIFLQHLVAALQQLSPHPNPGQLYCTALAVLDLALLHHHRIFPLPLTATSPRHRRTLIAAGCDQVRLSVAAVVASRTILGDYQDNVGLALHRLTDLPMREVEQLAGVILQVTQIVPAPPGT